MAETTLQKYVIWACNSVSATEYQLVAVLLRIAIMVQEILKWFVMRQLIFIPC